MRASVFSQGRGRASLREAKRSVCAACRADGAFRRRRTAPRARGDRRRGGDQGILRSKMRASRTARGALCADGGVSQSGRGSGDNKSRRVVGDHHHARRLFCFITDMRTPPEGARRRFASQIGWARPSSAAAAAFSMPGCTKSLPQRRVSHFDKLAGG